MSDRSIPPFLPLRLHLAQRPDCTIEIALQRRLVASHLLERATQVGFDLKVPSFLSSIAISSTRTFSTSPSGIRSVLQNRSSLRSSSRCSWVSITTFLASMPCFRELHLECDFPRSVLGPEEDCAFSRFAAQTAS